MFDLVGVGYVLVAFGILIAIGSVVLETLGNSVGGTANTNAVYVLGQLGSSGLAGWLPAIIAIVIGTGALALFFGSKGKSARY